MIQTAESSRCVLLWSSVLGLFLFIRTPQMLGDAIRVNGCEVSICSSPDVLDVGANGSFNNIDTTDFFGSFPASTSFDEQVLDNGQLLDTLGPLSPPASSWLAHSSGTFTGLTDPIFSDDRVFDFGVNSGVGATISTDPLLTPEPKMMAWGLGLLMIGLGFVRKLRNGTARGGDDRQKWPPLRPHA